VLDRLPALGFEDSPQITFIRHICTTGAAGSVGEGQTKAEVVFQADALTKAAVKLAAHVGLTYEIITDFVAFQQYAGQELYKQIIDCENAEILAGDSVGTDMDGFYTTPGILTYNAAAAAAPDTVWDSLDKSIAALRAGAALAEPDLLVLNPTDWSTIRRVKDAYGRYLVSPDPSDDQVNEAWGVPVLTTTQKPVGQGLFIDTKKFAYVAVREPLSMRVGYGVVGGVSDLTANILRFVGEERLVLCVTRPAAVLAIKSLPTPTAADTKAAKK
jgi:HK97 family phage major capsid protein